MHVSDHRSVETGKIVTGRKKNKYSKISFLLNLLGILQKDAGYSFDYDNFLGLKLF
jgi:hypothetical protein